MPDGIVARGSRYGKIQELHVWSGMGPPKVDLWLAGSLEGIPAWFGARKDSRTSESAVVPLSVRDGQLQHIENGQVVGLGAIGKPKD